MLNQNDIKNIIKQELLVGHDQFVIYPFGANGLNIKLILQEYFGIEPVFVVDNEWAEFNPNILTINQLREKYDNSMCILLSVENSKLNMQMQSELLEFADIGNIVNFKAYEQNLKIEKQRSLLEYIVKKDGEYKSEAMNLLDSPYNNKKILRIYSENEVVKLQELCYDYVKLQMKKETCGIENVQDAKNSILFIAPLFESYWTNILPLFKKYIEKGWQTVVMFAGLEDFWWTGENVERVLHMMREIKEYGGKCVLYDNSINSGVKFKKCFLCSEYSTYKPECLREFSDTVISVQTSGIYKHIYKGQVSMDILYHELECIDYYIGSDYMCDWINENNDAYKEKLYSLGYPKMDTMYNTLTKQIDIPQDWLEVAKDKKTILLTIENPDEFVEIFEKYPEVCFIWRPDPEFLRTQSCNQKIEKLKSKIPNLIIDENRTYVNAFKISDAMIGMAIFCVPMNYIFMQKPLLLLDGNLNMYNKSMALEYKNEAWYKAGYIAEDKTKIEEFIDMIVADKHYLQQKQMPYVDKMNQGFDGTVCDRIYDFFEKI